MDFIVMGQRQLEQKLHLHSMSNLPLQQGQPWSSINPLSKFYTHRRVRMGGRRAMVAQGMQGGLTMAALRMGSVTASCWLLAAPTSCCLNPHTFLQMSSQHA